MSLFDNCLSEHNRQVLLDCFVERNIALATRGEKHEMGFETRRKIRRPVFENVPNGQNVLIWF